MLALHKGLDAGLSLAEALRDARAAQPGDAVHEATGLGVRGVRRGVTVRADRRRDGSRRTRTTPAVKRRLAQAGCA
ncbi:hypothetical protein [Streptomyces sp. NPDC007905]|uniref:hypothetical protein n=1 Tax=Streptomyces sp. NPDC007905 TaxID=3364788 RepID=UPI0036E77C99